MSGGSYDYVYRHFINFAYRVEDRAKGSPNDALRLAFAKHVIMVAEAAKALEWTDSGDCSYPSEEEPIRKCLGLGLKE